MTFYRHLLTRTVSPMSATSLARAGHVTFVMLNPSTADEWTDDPTIRRCVGFVRRWGYASLRVVNLFPLRATKPADLKRATDAERGGSLTDHYILDACRHAGIVVLAWGAHGADYPERVASVRRMIALVATNRVVNLGWTAAGEPRHPLMVRADAMVRID